MAAAIAATNKAGQGPATMIGACTVPSGVFVPLREFEQRGVEPSLAVRLAETGNPEEARKQFVARQPMGRLGSPEEIAEGVLLLARTAFCTGTILTIDGGMTM